MFAVTEGGLFLVERTLHDLEAALDSERFAPIHKQTIVNLEKLAAPEPIAKGGATARMQSGRIVEGRRYAPSLRARLGQAIGLGLACSKCVHRNLKVSDCS